MDSYFVGTKSAPEFLVDVSKKTKQVSIYKPDKYSKDEEFYEKYSLGKIVWTSSYEDIVFIKKPVAYKKQKYTSGYTPEIIIKANNKYILVSEKITQLKQK